MGRFKNRTGNKGMRRTIRRDAVEGPDERAPRSGPKPPEVHLRRLRVEAALDKLAMEVDRHRFSGTPELLIVHGKGMGSEGGLPVIAPLVREWIKENPERIASWRPAPPDWGGEGAVVVCLKGIR